VSDKYVQSLAGSIIIVVVRTIALFVAMGGMLVADRVYGLMMTMCGLGVAFGIHAFQLTLRLQPWLWPLPGVKRVLSESDGAFGFRRKHEVHTGVDLYCDEGQEACAIEDGQVLLVVEFTGERVGSPWWNPTKAVLVLHGNCVVVYGEIEPLPTIRDEMRVRRGQPLGKVLRVRKKNCGKPTTMLHLELWESTEDVVQHYTGNKATVANDWPLDGKRPKGLLDPTSWLKDAEV